MKLKQLIGIFGVLVLAACDTDIEPIDQRFVGPDGQDPAAYAAYVAALRSYKQSDHYVVCARFDNNPEKVTSEKESLRSMPDSLDIVMLANPLSTYDREDLPGVQRKGTKVLAMADCSDLASAAAKLDAALASVAADALDGVVIHFPGAVTDAAKTLEAAIAQKLSSLSGKTFVFSGNVAFVAAANRDKYAFFLIDATASENVYVLQSDIDYLTGYLGIPAGKVIPAVAVAGTINDAQSRPQAAPAEVAKTVVKSALGGLALSGISSDYYDVSTIYPRVKETIELLNPAHK